jgi:1-acyl-sn-glycerol-3-phosphate acyltransferase
VNLRDFLQILFFVFFVRPFVTLFIGLRTRGLENVPKKGPFVLVANHSSHLDTVCLLSLFPLRRLREIRPVAAADYFDRNRIVSAFSRTLFNILPIPRKDFTEENHPVRRMRDAIDQGYSLIVFPEGTRGSGEELGKFRTGVARAVEGERSVAVVPAYLVNMGRSLPKGEWFPIPFFCEVRIGRPMLLEGKDYQEKVAAVEAAVRRLAAGEPAASTP